MKSRPTIRDVAKKAGLSLSTISLVLNNKGYVSDKNKQKVQRIIKELDYHPQRSARGLASQLSGNIGFILTEDHFSQSEPFYTRIFLGTEFEARNHNYYILLTTVRKNVKETSEIPRFFLEHNVDGVIIAGKIGSSWIEYINSRHIPLLLVDYIAPRVSNITIDNGAGAELVVQHFLKGGHRKIGFIGGDINHPSIHERFIQYQNVLLAAGIVLSEKWYCIDQPNTTSADGYEAIKKIFNGNDDRPTAIFAANDAMALGCMQYLKENGFKIPRDVAIAGFDNIEAGLHIEPRLTTVNVHREEMGKLAVQRIVEMIKEKSGVVTRTITPIELVVRDSCGIKTDQ
jgi:LacI family transcriptional regulator